jgi:type I restriction enzyme S subunit
MGVIERLKVPIPPPQEQQRIAAYLDASCAAIDAAVAAKRRQLDTLDALRESIIHKAVTCGLNDAVELKDSGVEWLGKLPVHWQIKRIKDIVDLKSGDAITSDSITPIGNYPVFGGNGLRGYTISYTHNGYYVLIGRQGALCGNINYAEGKFWASEHAVVAITLKKHDTFWLGELLRVMNLNQYSNAAAQPGLAVERIKFLRIPIPPYEEQIRISSWLKNTIIKNEEMVSVLRKQIATLTAYRKSLIHECVTGQRRISEADVVRSQLSAKTGQLNREPYEKNVRLKMAGGDDQTCSANFGKAIKGGGQGDPLLALKSATRRGN